MLSHFVQSVSKLSTTCSVLQRKRYGVIELRDGAFERIRFRPFPKIVTAWDFFRRGENYHRQTPGDHCQLYFNHSLRCPRYLSLMYVVSTQNSTLATTRFALEILDEIARIKKCDAIVCDAANLRISDRLLARWGWEPLAHSRWHRNFVRRFYGNYPPLPSRVKALFDSASSPVAQSQHAPALMSGS